MNKPQIIGPSKPVVAIDIDGTLAKYHAWFLHFAELYLGKPMPIYESMEIVREESLWRFMRVSKSTYREVKLAYRQGGMKRSMPAFADASNMVRAIRRSGAEVWICTTRPYLRLDNIDPDTRHWLRRNHITADGVIYGERKYRQLARIVGTERILGSLDDLPEMCEQARDVGIKPMCITRPHNAWISGVPGSRVPDLPSAQAVFQSRIKQWKEQRNAS